MNVVILDGREQGQCSDCNDALDHALANIFRTVREEKRWFILCEMYILPCRSCGACAHITPGECVFKDDMPQIMWQVAAADVIVLVTSIQFGGYGSQLKKAVDKLILMGCPLYMVRDGHVLHPMRYGCKGLLGVGLEENSPPSSAAASWTQESVEAFKSLVAQNALNMQFCYDTLIIPPSGCEEDAVSSSVSSMLEQLRKGVVAHETP